MPIGPIGVRYTFHCDACDAQCVQSHSVAAEGVVPKPIAPLCWTQVGPLLICPKHQISWRDREAEATG